MKKEIILLCLVLLAAICTSHAQGTLNSKIKLEERDKWIKETSKDLKNFKPDSTIKIIADELIDMVDFKKISFRVINNGIIKLNNGDWIYITTNSSHENEAIGDISLAIDNSKTIFKNEGHVCGGIIHFETSQITELQTSADFFKYFVGDSDSKGWKKLD